MENQQSIRLNGLPLVSTILANEATEIVLNAQITAQRLQSARAPLTVVCSVDRSGSMAGEKLKLTLATLRFLVTQLGAQDKFGLVVWDDQVQTICSPQLMHEKGKEAAMDAIRQVRAGSTTNLSGGLLQGLQEVLQDPALTEPGRTSSVLLFTDGLANRGLTESGRITECMRGALGECADGSTPSVFTFGFGEDHDAEMLRAISDQGDGLYYYVQNKEAIPQTFADCLGGLLSVVAQNLTLTVEATGGATITKLHSKVPVKEAANEEGELNDRMQLVLGDVYSEEVRNILLTLRVPASEPTDSFQLCRLSVNGFDTIAAKPSCSNATVSLSRVLELPQEGAPQLAEVAAQFARVNAAEAMEQANVLGKEGRFAECRALLGQSRDLLRHTIGCEELEADMAECLLGMMDEQSFATKGSKSCMNYSSAAHRERSCAFRVDRVTSYQSPQKAMMCEQAAAFMEQEQEQEVQDALDGRRNSGLLDNLRNSRVLSPVPQLNDGARQLGSQGRNMTLPPRVPKAAKTNRELVSRKTMTL